MTVQPLVALAMPERAGRAQLKRQIQQYKLAAVRLEGQIRKARRSQSDTPEIREALDAASLKLAAVKEELSGMEDALKALRKAR
jgi:hypothetical protein